jgi:hypothetical protein
MSPVINGVIILESEPGEYGFPVIVRSDCPPNAMYFLPKGSTTWNLATGETLQLAPGYYVNPRQLGMIKDVK